jgi:hypothetical protein
MEVIMDRYQNVEEDDRIDLGAVSVETKGNGGADIDVSHQRLQSGLSDD